MKCYASWLSKSLSGSSNPTLNLCGSFNPLQSCGRKWRRFPCVPEQPRLRVWNRLVYTRAGAVASRLDGHRVVVSHVLDAYKSSSCCVSDGSTFPQGADSGARFAHEADMASMPLAPLVHAILPVAPDEFEKLPPKCRSCGVILQTHSETQPGFVPGKKFLDSVKDQTLHKISCYNCFNLQHYNKRITLRQSNENVLEHLRHVERRKALILYLVDMFDMDGTMFKDLLKVVGEKKRVILVGTKVDRIPQDTAKVAVQLERMKDALKEACLRNGLDGCNFRDICVISAKTGYGIHTLVSKINKHRDAAMDVYVMGCANVGKSTLFNLLQNALAVHKSEAMPGQAIAHHCPGTTVGLLRAKIGLRKLEKLEWRLKHGPWEAEGTYDLDDELYDMLGVPKEATVHNDSRKELRVPSTAASKGRAVEIQLVDESEKEIRQTHIYDTPGVMNESQIIQYLTPEEINYLSPERWIVPRTFLLKPNQCLFVGGLARLDYLKFSRPVGHAEGDELNEPEEEDESVSKGEDGQIDGENSHDKGAEALFVTLFCSPNVPGHVTTTVNADEKYEKLFGTEVFKIPIGSEGRRQLFPPLKPVDYVVQGLDRNTSSADLALHGVGWLAIAAVRDAEVLLSLHTPNGVGQGIRRPSMLPFSVRQKGKRGKVYLGHPNPSVYTHTRQRSPQFVRVFQKQSEPTQAWQTRIKQKLKQERIEAKEELRAERLASGDVRGRMLRLLKAEKKSAGQLQDGPRELKS